MSQPAFAAVGSLILALVPFQSPQDEEPEPTTPIMQLRREVQTRLETGLVGAWQLDAFLEDGIPLPPGEIIGYAVVCDGYMAMVIHAIGFDELSQVEVLLAQAGLFRYRVDGFSALQTATVIGHNSGDEELLFEREGVLREYELQLEGDLLNIHHRRGTTLALSRVSADETTDARGMADALAAFGFDERETEEALPLDQRADEGPLNPLMQARREEVEALTTGIVGGWRLSAYLLDGERVDPEDVSGYAVFCDGTMSLVIHSFGYDDLLDEEYPVGQAGIFHYEIDEFGHLQTETIIGHANPFDEIEYEAPGDERDYSAHIDALTDELHLDHPSGTTLVFARLGPPAFSEEETERLHHLRGARAFDAESDEDE